MNRRIVWALGLAAAALVAGSAWAGSATQAADDIISRILQTPPAPSAPLPRPAVKPAAAPLPVVMGARIGEHANSTRFVVEVSDPITLRAFTLANPNRVVLDMPAVQWHLSDPPRPSGNGAVSAYRYGQFRSGNSRFVIDLNRPVAVVTPKVIPPTGGYGYRFVIDLTPASQEEFNRMAGWPDDLRAREAAAEHLHPRHD